MAICEKYGWHKPLADQCEYHAIVRTNVEKELYTVFDKFKYGTTVYSPLAGGLLSGKYNDGNFPEGSWYEKDPFSKGAILSRFVNPANKEKNFKLLNDVATLAKNIGCSQAQLCLAWVIVNKDVSTCIFGASRVE